MGGLVALLFAEQHQTRAKALVLVAPAFVFGLPDNVSAERLAIGANPTTPESMAAYLTRIYDAPDLSPAAINEALAHKQSIGDGQTIKRIAQSLVSGEGILTEERLRQITHSTLIIQGSSDGVVPVSSSERISRIMTNAELVVRTDVGHWPQFEDADYFNTSVLGLLEGSALGR